MYASAPPAQRAASPCPPPPPPTFDAPDCPVPAPIVGGKMWPGCYNNDCRCADSGWRERKSDMRGQWYAWAVVVCCFESDLKLLHFFSLLQLLGPSQAKR